MRGMDPEDRILELVRLTATSLPEDVAAALRRARRREKPSSAAAAALNDILANIRLAEKASTPLCQDTGIPTFYIDERLRGRVTEDCVRAAVAEATRRGWLRKNCIDPVTGKSQDDNCGVGIPAIHWRRGIERDGRPAAALLLKGGGSENVSRQYSLPDATLGPGGAGRDLEGVRRCILHAATAAQGRGCAPGILGVCIGGDRAEGFAAAKEQLLRSLDDASPDPALARLERRTLREANSLGIGPMGLGGKTTLLGVKIAARHRLPASFFVTVAYMCWALRRRSVAF